MTFELGLERLSHWESRGRTFQAKATASAKVLWQACARHSQGPARKPVTYCKPREKRRTSVSNAVDRFHG